MVEGVAECLLCSICDEICKRGAQLKCCGVRACRACAVVKVNKTRKCWNDDCGKDVAANTDLINDDVLRKAVDNFNKTGELDPEDEKALNKSSTGPAIKEKKVVAKKPVEKKDGVKKAKVDVAEKFNQQCKFGSRCQKAEKRLCLYKHDPAMERAVTSARGRGGMRGGPMGPRGPMGMRGGMGPGGPMGMRGGMGPMGMGGGPMGGGPMGMGRRPNFFEDDMMEEDMDMRSGMRGRMDDLDMRSGMGGGPDMDSFFAMKKMKDNLERMMDSMMDGGPMDSPMGRGPGMGMGRPGMGMLGRGPMGGGRGPMDMGGGYGGPMRGRGGMRGGPGGPMRSSVMEKRGGRGGRGGSSRPNKFTEKFY